MIKEEFQVHWKRYRRQLQERLRKVENNQRPLQYYLNKQYPERCFVFLSKESI